MFSGSGRLKVVATLMVFSLAAMLDGCSLNPQKTKLRYLESGKRYLKAGKYQEASIQFRNAIKVDPRFTEAYYQLAQADLSLRQWNGAFAALRQTLDLDPQRVDAHVDIGRLYLASKEYQKADDEASLILEREPGNASAYELRGAAMLARQELEKALQAYVQLVELQPQDPMPYADLAVVEFDLKRFTEAEQHFRKAIELAPLAIPSYTNLANFYRQRQQLPEAEQVLRDGVDRNPNAVPLYINWAALLYAQQKTEAVAAILDKLRGRQRNSAEVAIVIGDFYLQRGQNEPALTEYRRGLEAAPKNVEIQKRMVELFLITGRYDEAAKLNDGVLRQERKNLAAHIARGRILLGQGKPDEAISELRQQTTDAPDSPQAHYYLALAHWQKGSTAQAKSELQEALRVAPTMILALNSLAELNLSLGDLTLAQEYAQRSVQQDQANPASRLLLGRVLAQGAQWKAAEKEFLIAQRLSPGDPAPHVNMGVAYVRQQQWAKAEEELETALRLAPRSTEALAQLASLWLARNQEAKAVARVQQYLATYPEDALGHLILGGTQFSGKEYDAAQSEFERAIEMNPSLTQAHLQLARVHQAKGQTQAAIAQYETALSAQPRSANLLTVIASLYEATGNLDAARKYYEQALAIDPSSAVPANNLAFLYVKQDGNLDLALGLAQKAKQLLPETNPITDTLGWVLYKKGDYASALPLLQECVEKKPNSAVYRYHLGMVLAAVGQKEKAKDQLESALRLRLVGEDADEAKQMLARN
jgi:tetratricopeptide (TPR) repeat protein